MPSHGTGRTAGAGRRRGRPSARRRRCPHCEHGSAGRASAVETRGTDAQPPRRLAIGLMGAAGGRHRKSVRRQAFSFGAAVARRGAVLVTGACPGLPHEGVLGARSAGGLTVGISPGLSLHEHRVKYGSPDEGYDVLVYTGSGLMGREVTNIRTSDIVVIAGGRSGTLGEFAIAFDEGKLIGVLEGSGGITTILPRVMASFSKETGAEVLYDRDPDRLMDRLLDRYRTHHYRRPSCFCEPGAAGPPPSRGRGRRRRAPEPPAGPRLENRGRRMS